MTGIAVRTVAAVVSAVAGILAGILGQWLTSRIYWGVLAGLLVLIAVVAGAEIIKVRAENAGSPTGTDREGTADQSGEPGRQQTRISVGKNSKLTHSVIAGGDVDQSQTINMHRRHPALSLVAISAVAMLAAVGGTVYLVTQPGAGTRGSSRVPAEVQPPRNRISHQISPLSMLPRYNPPRLFDGKSIDLPGGPPAVADGVAYSYTDDALTATRIADGHSLWTVSLPGSSELVSGPMSQGSPPSPGIITTDSGQRLIVAAYFTTIPGSGIQAAQDETKVLAVDTSGTVRWERTAPAPRTALPVLFVGQLHDSRGNAFVLDGGDTMVLNADNGAVRWTAPDVHPDGVAGDKVIGQQVSDDEFTYTTVALAGTDGSVAWEGASVGTDVIAQPPFVLVAGPTRVVVSSDSGWTILLDAATGKPVSRLTPPPQDLTSSDFRCLFDGQQTIVCWQPSTDSGTPVGQTIAFDAQTGRKLWTLPANANQVGVDVSCAYDGRVYGTANGTVVLDARTGAQLAVDNDTTAPTMVGPGYGIYVAASAGDTTTVSLATG